jgi:CRISPR-associated protein Cas1
LLRRAQYRTADDADGHARHIATAMIAAKIANARASLLRAARDGSDANRAAPLRRAADNLADDLRHLDNAATLDTLRGAEGDAADDYFRVFNLMLTSQQHAFEFTTRSRRPPTDNINALLSFLYTLLAHDVRAACESVGLDPQVGFLHRDRPGRPSLALDLMEELRPVLADRMAVTLINRQQIAADGFTTSETGSVKMSDKTRKTVITAWQKRKAETITHPFLQEKITVGLLPHIQARLLARHLRGDLDQYPPFFWR